MISPPNIIYTGPGDLHPPLSTDVGQCFARIPRSLHTSSGTLILLQTSPLGPHALCLALPVDAQPVSRRHSLSSPAEIASPLFFRADLSLLFAPTEQCGDVEAPPFLRVAAVTPGKREPPARAVKRSPRRRKSHAGQEEAIVWHVAEEVRIHVLPGGASLDASVLLARAKTALRCVGCIPLANDIFLSGGGGMSGALLARLVPRPSGPVFISSLTTRFSLAESSPGAATAGNLTRVAISGSETSQAFSAVRSLLSQPVQSLWSLGAAPMTGLLLSGPPGIGKTRAAFMAARASGFRVISVARGRDASHGGPARALRAAFSEAHALQIAGIRALVFIDEIDTLCPKRAGSIGAGVGSGAGAEEVRAVAQLLTLMDGGRRRVGGEVGLVMFVIAATNRPGALDAALRRPGRFDREVTLQAPGLEERALILRSLDERLNLASAAEVAGLTAGFVAADLVQLRDEAAKISDAVMLADVAVEFNRALRLVRPSLLRGRLSSEVGTMRWEDIGGLEDVKRRLRMAVEWPLEHPDTFLRLGLHAPRGILLHGPPGTSKTTLVRAMATSGRANFLHMSGADVYSCFVGEAERLLREAFDTARAACPSILFLDEIDSLVGKRDASASSGSSDGNQVQSRVLSTLLTEMDGLASSTGVLVVGATNRVDLLDDALLRPGRFDEVIEIPALSDEDRLAVLRIHSGKLPLDIEVDLERLSNSMPNATGAQVQAVCQEAALCALRCQTPLREGEGKVLVDTSHFEMAVDTVLSA